MKGTSKAKILFSSGNRYLQEFKPLGTGGGLYHFRDQIQAGNPEAIIVIHSDVFCIPPLSDMVMCYREKNATSSGKFIVLGTQVGSTILIMGFHHIPCAIGIGGLNN